MKNRKKQRVFIIICTTFLLSLLSICAYAADGGRVELPEPEKSGGVALLQALSDRHTSREFSDTDLTPQQLSNLLWATAGVNRPDGKTTYPTAINRQDMSVYVFTRDGIYLYLPNENALEPVATGDRRADSGGQPFVANAAVNMAYVQDMSRWKEGERGQDWGFAHTGAMMQNAYLYAAGQGWSAVARGMFDQKTVAKLLNLNDKQIVRLIQSIGPK